MDPPVFLPHPLFPLSISRCDFALRSELRVEDSPSWACRRMERGIGGEVFNMSISLNPQESFSYQEFCPWSGEEVYLLTGSHVPAIQSLANDIPTSLQIRVSVFKTVCSDRRWGKNRKIKEQRRGSAPVPLRLTRSRISGFPSLCF